MTIWSQVATALAGITIPKAASLYVPAAGELPDQYLVYFLVSSPPELHADNLEKLRSNRVQVSIYSRSGLTGLPDVSTPMVAAGFARGPMRELPYNQLTRHFALALEFIILEES